MTGSLVQAGRRECQPSGRGAADRAPWRCSRRQTRSCSATFSGKLGRARAEGMHAELHVHLVGASRRDVGKTPTSDDSHRACVASRRGDQAKLRVRSQRDRCRPPDHAPDRSRFLLRGCATRRSHSATPCQVGFEEPLHRAAAVAAASDRAGSASSGLCHVHHRMRSGRPAVPGSLPRHWRSACLVRLGFPPWTATAPYLRPRFRIGHQCDTAGESRHW